MAYESGNMLAGRYRLDERIAAGGMGEVWEATDIVLDRPVAVKTLRADRAIDPQFQNRFRHEARSLAALHHPGIVDVYDYGQVTGSDAYLVMARVPGRPLNLRIAERGRLTTAETMSIVAQSGRALQAAHDAGIVHRDVKPANMLVQDDGTVVLVDFGVAHSAGSATLTGAKEVVGTAHYIAPEQVSKQTVGPAADVYALGTVAYHCLAGHPPFFGDDPLSVAMQHVTDEPPPLPGDIPPQARALVTTAMAKDPAARYPSAAAMAAAADNIAGSGSGADVTAIVPLRTSYTTTVPTEPANRPGRGLMLALLAALLVLLGTGTALAMTDPFGWFPGTPQPSTSVPAPPSAEPSSTRPLPPPPDGTPSPATTTGSPSRTPSRPPSTSPSKTPSKPPSKPPSSSPSPTTTPSRTQSSRPPVSSPASQSLPASQDESSTLQATRLSRR